MPLGKAPCSRAFAAPGKYIQGPGEIARLPEYASSFGTSALILIDAFLFGKYSGTFTGLFKEQGMTAVCREFSGECDDGEIDAVREAAIQNGADVLVGFGGGRTLDTIKAAAALIDKPIILYPTAISTDAPTSASSIVYYADHTYRQVLHKKNPDYVVVDSDVVFHAPPRMFVAGMGDALATWVEARACLETDNINNVGKGYRRTMSGMALAKLCFDELLAKGRDALAAVRIGVRTELFEDIVEVNTLLSGVGFENTGCNVSHGVQASLSILPDVKAMLHGELVAFGVLCQLIAENRPMEEFRQAFDFCRDVGLPVTLAEMGIVEDREEKIRRIVHYGIENKAILKIEPFTMTEERLYNAIMFVDAFGARAKG